MVAIGSIVWSAAQGTLTVLLLMFIGVLLGKLDIIDAYTRIKLSRVRLSPPHIINT